MKEWKIKNEIIKPGDSKKIRLNVARLPSDSSIYIQSYIERSTQEGPTILVLGGVHGDEVCGVEIVRRCLMNGVFKDLKCGSVIAIPLLNVYGFIHFSREVPDGKDVNRSFPGNSRGSLASRVARALSRNILPHADVLLDFHSGGDRRYNYPQVRYSKKSEESRKLAEIFAAPFMIEKSEISKTLRKLAVKKGKPTLVYEGGESLRLDGFAIERGVSGIKRVLQHYGMIAEAPLIEASTKYVNQTTWIRASKSGIFIWSKSSGHKIEKGEPLGRIYDPYGTKEYIVSASKSGYIIGHNNAPVVHVGDALFHIATD